MMCLNQNGLLPDSSVQYKFSIKNMSADVNHHMVMSLFCFFVFVFLNIEGMLIAECHGVWDEFIPWFASACGSHWKDGGYLLT